MLLKSEDDHFTAGNVVKYLMHLIILVQSSEFNQGKTYIFQDSSKVVLIEALSNQKKIQLTLK